LLSLKPESRLEAGWLALRFSEVLRLYMTTTYHPDLRVCLGVLREFEKLSARLSDLEERIRPFSGRDLLGQRSGTTPDHAPSPESIADPTRVPDELMHAVRAEEARSADEPSSVSREVRRDQLLRRAIIANWLGADAALLPLLNLRIIAQAALGDGQPELFQSLTEPQLTQVELRGRERQISVRWFRPGRASGELYGRILARGLTLDHATVVQQLEEFDFGTVQAQTARWFLWRTRSAPENPHLYLRGTTGAADVRIACSGDAVLEVEIATTDDHDADLVLGAITSAAATAAKPVPADGIAAIVRARTQAQFTAP
jgi:hypothetical protein